MATYVDGFVIPIKKSKLKAYKKMATLGRDVWMDHGALHYFECSADELKSKWGVSFTKLCDLKAGETVIFAFIVFKSKAHRNQVNKKVHKDPRMAPPEGKKWEMPFDMKRFTVGGFKTLVSS